METIARIKTDFPEKFGIPRQSGRIRALTGTLVFEPKFRTPDAVKGLEEFNYIWLLWKFDVPESETFHATVRPPRLGGNTRVGVFATRSPFRPNRIGLSCVRLEEIRMTENGPELIVSGVDMKDGTEIVDIKPYIPYTDAKEDATGSFADELKDYHLNVEIPDEILQSVPEEKRAALTAVLAEDPRPSYHDDPARIYGISYAGLNISFQVCDGTLTVLKAIQAAPPNN
jgi:tRNA-Thr(GGU) m(6)t(6)A37 methyltransferase TsaA